MIDETGFRKAIEAAKVHLVGSPATFAIVSSYLEAAKQQPPAPQFSIADRVAMTESVLKPPKPSEAMVAMSERHMPAAPVGDDVEQRRAFFKWIETTNSNDLHDYEGLFAIWRAAQAAIPNPTALIRQLVEILGYYANKSNYWGCLGLHPDAEQPAKLALAAGQAYLQQQEQSHDQSNG